MNTGQEIRLFSLIGWASYVVSIFGIGYSFVNQTIGFTIFGVFIVIAFLTTFYGKRLKKNSTTT